MLLFYYEIVTVLVFFSIRFKNANFFSENVSTDLHHNNQQALNKNE
jgi:hypothetical protein